MVIAFVASLTLLPALLTVMHPPGEPDTVETAGLAAVDRWIAGHRRLVIVATAAVVTLGLPLLARLPFDANPMNLRSRAVESVATFFDLAKDPDTSPNSIDVLAPSADEPPRWRRGSRRCPRSRASVTHRDVHPRRSGHKLAVIQDAAMLLGPVLHPPAVSRRRPMPRPSRPAGDGAGAARDRRRGPPTRPPRRRAGSPGRSTGSRPRAPTGARRPAAPSRSTTCACSTSCAPR